MHPNNVACLTAAGVDCCVLANNHVLDWGRRRLSETLSALHAAGIQTTGAGANLREAESPAVLHPVPGAARVLVFAAGSLDCGIGREWAVRADQPGVALLDGFTNEAIAATAERVRAVKQPGDVAVFSIHWGGNWGYRIPEEHVSFAHALIDAAGIDIVHGHSSHHAKGIEVYRGKLILYGCGDFINDYEGISGHEQYRSWLVLAYLPAIDAATGRLVRLELIPFATRRFRLERAAREDVEWLCGTLGREVEKLGSRLERAPGGGLLLAPFGESHATR